MRIYFCESHTCKYNNCITVPANIKFIKPPILSHSNHTKVNSLKKNTFEDRSNLEIYFTNVRVSSYIMTTLASSTSSLSDSDNVIFFGLFVHIISNSEDCTTLSLTIELENTYSSLKYIINNNTNTWKDVPNDIPIIKPATPNPKQ